MRMAHHRGRPPEAGLCYMPGHSRGRPLEAGLCFCPDDAIASIFDPACCERL